MVVIRCRRSPVPAPRAEPADRAGGEADESVAATLCYSTTEPQVRLTGVFVDQFRGPLGPVGTSTPTTGDFNDVTIRDESACRRYQLPATFVLDAADEVHVGASSFELAPA